MKLGTGGARLMVGRIPQHIIEEILDRVSIREVVEDYVRLVKDGANLKGLCPFHQEKTPSFKVHEAKKIYKCFGCGEGGNAINFLMKMEAMSYPEAVVRLAARAGVDLPEREQTPEERKKEEERDQLFEANLAAARFYRDTLQDSAEALSARAYLERRGFKPETIKRFGLGYSPDSWSALFDRLTAQGVRPEALHGAGLALPRDSGGYYDRFRGRLMFPIQDVQGRVRGFGARTLKDEPDQPKYINTPETPVFKKGAGFYGLYQAKEAIRKSGRALVVEGYFDQIALDQAGLSYAVATLGTALTTEHAAQLRRYGAQVFIVFDADEAGQKASLRALEVFLEAGMSPRIVVMPEGKDPDGFLQNHSPAEFEALLDKAPPLLSHYMRQRLEQAGPTPAERARAVGEAARMTARVQDNIEQGFFIEELSRLSGVPVRELAVRVQPPRPRGPSSRAEDSAGRKNDDPDYPRAELDLLKIIIHHPECAPEIRKSGALEKLTHSGIAGILSELLVQAETSGKTEPAKVTDKISDPGLSNRITGVILERDPFAGFEAKALQDVIRALDREAIKQSIQALTRQIAEAEKSGDRQRFRELIEQRQALAIEQSRIAGGSA